MCGRGRAADLALALPIMVCAVHPAASYTGVAGVAFSWLAIQCKILVAVRQGFQLCSPWFSAPAGLTVAHNQSLFLDGLSALSMGWQRGPPPLVAFIFPPCLVLGRWLFG